MNDETKQLLMAVLDRLDVIHAEVKANTAENTQRFDQVNQRFDQVNQRFDQVNQRLDRVEQANERTNQRLDSLEQRIAQLFERLKTLEEQMLAIGFELKEDIAKLTDKISRLEIDVFTGRADAARAIVAINNLEKRVAALEAERRAA